MPETPLLQHVRVGDPYDLKGYEGVGGYQSVRKIVGRMSPADVVEAVKDSGLRGRGGAGFGTGMKWSFVPQGEDSPSPKYLVCNADEMEPGTFKDRMLMEGHPHQLVEGMICAAYAIQASVGYIFLRAEYRPSELLLLKAIAEAKEAGLLGENILGSGWDFELHLHTSAGRYICGEETALLNALEGRRATPRAKPPFPPAAGLWGKPTIINNVETLCNVPHIINHGSEWFKNLAPDSPNGGTKLYGASGKVKRPGIWELPLGTTIREILEEHAGGMQDGLRFKALLPGGASTDFLVEQHLDTPMDYETIAKAGSRLGTGTMIVVDDRTSIVSVVHNLIDFFSRESCGWCTPCRDGLPFTEQVLRALKEERGRGGDIDTLRQHTKYLWLGCTFCALAPGAMEPLMSALKYFEDEFQAAIREAPRPGPANQEPAAAAAAHG
ncbi:MAG: NADH-quinone oxidoreductase subunit NuoF [Opitutales bacterium]